MPWEYVQAHDNAVRDLQIERVGGQQDVDRGGLRYSNDLQEQRSGYSHAKVDDY